MNKETDRVTISRTEYERLQEDSVYLRTKNLLYGEEVLRTVQAEHKRELEAKDEEIEKCNEEALILVAYTDELEKELEEQRNRNAYLFRRLKDKACKEQGIDNKKDCSGFILLSSRQYEERISHGYDPDYGMAYQTVKAWKSVIQTPLSVDIDYDIVNPMIMDMFRHENALEEFGCYNMTNESGDYPGTSNDDQVNTLFRWFYNANFRNGYWEMELYTTQPLKLPDGIDDSFYNEEENDAAEA